MTDSPVGSVPRNHQWRCAWFLLILALLAPARLDAQTTPTLVISEFLAVNDTGIKDEDGEYSDWIELHNYGAQTVNLESVFLTDNPNKLRQWRLPEYQLESGAYRLIFLSGKDRKAADSPWHANFSLNRKGEYLALIASDGRTIIHEYAPTFPKQQRDMSYGIGPDWTAGASPNRAATFFATPSPGQKNTRPAWGEVEGVKFNVRRGWHRDPFKLRLKTKTRGAQIRYTLDGSVPTETNGQPYESPLLIEKSTTIRARAFKAQHKAGQTSTRTFLFVEDVLHQSPDGLPPNDFPFTWGRNKVNYGMDPRLISEKKVMTEMIDGFYSLPSFSLVMDLEHLFEEANGIYANAEEDGREWERPCSMELIHGDHAKGFQIDCGVRMRGGFSRRPDNPKHSFRFFFRDNYGPSKLNYPLFGKNGARSFDHIDLRTFQNYAWHLGSRQAVFLRDQFCRDLQLGLGQPAARGEFCHLFINGQYWGIYNTCERIKASYGAAYFGGKKEDYDSIKHGRSYDEKTKRHLGVMANDGNLQAWERLWNFAKAGLASNEDYFRILGRNPDGSENPDMECLLDVDNLIDYMLVTFYGGNYDGPISAWGQNMGPNNWYGLRNRTTRDGFRFFIWDAEHSLKDVREDRTGPFPAGESFGGSNPQWLWQQCLENEEFRVRVGDRIQKHCYGEGALTPAAVRDRFIQRINELESAALCESARWGDAVFTASGERSPEHQAPRTRERHWWPEIERILNEYIPARTEIILTQLFGHGVISDLAVPNKSHDTSPGRGLVLTSEHGKVYYTTDGTDPRQVGGDISPHAILSTGEPIPDATDHRLQARTFLRGDWSALISVPNQQ